MIDWLCDVCGGEIFGFEEHVEAIDGAIMHVECAKDYVPDGWVASLDGDNER